MKDTNEKVWEALIMYDVASGEFAKVYVSKDEAIIDFPTYKDEGYVIKPCEIRLAKVKRK